MDDRFGEMLDTLPDARARYYEMIRQLTPEQRAAKVVSLSRAVRDLARRHPQEPAGCEPCRRRDRARVAALRP